MTSIKANLVAWLVGALTVGAVVALGATYVFAHQELSRMFDQELRQIARAVHLREDWRETGTVRAARPEFVYAVRAYDYSGRVFFETVLPSRPFAAPRTYAAGFSVLEGQGEEWRVYTHLTPEGIVQVAQPQATRDALARELSLRMLLPVLLPIPLLAALIRWVLTRGLAPLSDTSRRVSDRDATRLDPLPTADVPTELLPLVEQINALLQRLSVALESQQRFLAGAAHELRSPIAALSLQAQLAERAQAPTARETAFADLKLGIARAGGLVQQMLDLERLDASARAQSICGVDVARIAREVVGSYAAHADMLGVDLGADAQTVATVHGAEPELRSLVANLVDNALRYAPRASEVTVSVRQRSGAVDLRVVDEGPGIPTADRERVFERLQRMKDDCTRGSNLGLAIVKAIVQRHDGTVALADASPGRDLPGLIVLVTLPAEDVVTAATETAPSR